MSYIRETPTQTEALARLAEQLKRDHPQSIVGIDSGAVWLSDGVKDWGIFSLYIGSDLPVQVYDAKTRTTVLHRMSSERKPEWREILDPRAPDVDAPPCEKCQGKEHAAPDCPYDDGEVRDAKPRCKHCDRFLYRASDDSLEDENGLVFCNDQDETHDGQRHEVSP